MAAAGSLARARMPRGPLQPARLRDLAHYLQHGTYPHWPGAAAPGLSGLLEPCLADHPDGLRALLASLADQPAVAQRLATHVPAPLRARLAALAPEAGLPGSDKPLSHASPAQPAVSAPPAAGPEAREDRAATSAVPGDPTAALDPSTRAAPSPPQRRAGSAADLPAENAVPPMPRAAPGHPVDPSEAAGSRGATPSDPAPAGPTAPQGPGAANERSLPAGGSGRPPSPGLPKAPSAAPSPPPAVDAPDARVPPGGDRVLPLSSADPASPTPAATGTGQFPAGLDTPTGPRSASPAARAPAGAQADPPGAARSGPSASPIRRVAPAQDVPRPGPSSVPGGSRAQNVFEGGATDTPPPASDPTGIGSSGSAGPVPRAPAAPPSHGPQDPSEPSHQPSGSEVDRGARAPDPTSRTNASPGSDPAEDTARAFPTAPSRQRGDPDTPDMLGQGAKVGPARPQAPETAPPVVPRAAPPNAPPALGARRAPEATEAPGPVLADPLPARDGARSPVDTTARTPHDDPPRAQAPDAVPRVNDARAEVSEDTRAAPEDSLAAAASGERAPAASLPTAPGLTAPNPGAPARPSALRPPPQDPGAAPVLAVRAGAHPDGQDASQPRQPSHIRGDETPPAPPEIGMDWAGLLQTPTGRQALLSPLDWTRIEAAHLALLPTLGGFAVTILRAAAPDDTLGPHLAEASLTLLAGGGFEGDARRWLRAVLRAGSRGRTAETPGALAAQLSALASGRAAEPRFAPLIEMLRDLQAEESAPRDRVQDTDPPPATTRAQGRSPAEEPPMRAEVVLPRPPAATETPSAAMDVATALVARYLRPDAARVTPSGPPPLAAALAAALEQVSPAQRAATLSARLGQDQAQLARRAAAWLAAVANVPLSAADLTQATLRAWANGAASGPDPSAPVPLESVLSALAEIASERAAQPLETVRARMARDLSEPPEGEAGQALSGLSAHELASLRAALAEALDTSASAETHPNVTPLKSRDIAPIAGEVPPHGRMPETASDGHVDGNPIGRPQRPETAAPPTPDPTSPETVRTAAAPAPARGASPVPTSAPPDGVAAQDTAGVRSSERGRDQSASSPFDRSVTGGLAAETPEDGATPTDPADGNRTDARAPGPDAQVALQQVAQRLRQAGLGLDPQDLSRRLTAANAAAPIDAPDGPGAFHAALAAGLGTPLGSLMDHLSPMGLPTPPARHVDALETVARALRRAGIGLDPRDLAARLAAAHAAAPIDAPEGPGAFHAALAAALDTSVEILLAHLAPPPAPLAPAGEIHTGLAGLVLLHVHLATYLARSDCLDPSGGLRDDSRPRAVHLLALLASGRMDLPEHELALPKLLCGMPLATPLAPGGAATPEEAALAESLLGFTASQVAAFANTDADALRETFVMRHGVIRRPGPDAALTLQVTKGPFDMLLGGIPWPWSVVALPWMPEALHVSWT
ncbi:hypothetical protein Dshi_2456 [Dinoroseobacter shibae DFL 12 = DSM 16493]|uniref:Uncharacterized protein n=1 Tax=Dinoroseobacter shibae (strain DSM 16493 / NCIMB 14021 / DFL 12) TaxID=398580 RepID=A8LS97_DINSH|nr:hypothetical protein Dshi_2456 [Dinoroseobacter shibae DFL 12 = DSM 16493]